MIGESMKRELCSRNHAKPNSKALIVKASDSFLSGSAVSSQCYWERLDY